MANLVLSNGVVCAPLSGTDQLYADATGLVFNLLSAQDLSILLPIAITALYQKIVAAQAAGICLLPLKKMSDMVCCRLGKVDCNNLQERFISSLRRLTNQCKYVAQNALNWNRCETYEIAYPSAPNTDPRILGNLIRQVQVQWEADPEAVTTPTKRVATSAA